MFSFLNMVRYLSAYYPLTHPAQQKAGIISVKSRFFFDPATSTFCPLPVMPTLVNCAAIERAEPSQEASTCDSA